jgi:hypothetical protein
MGIKALGNDWLPAREFHDGPGEKTLPPYEAEYTTASDMVDDENTQESWTAMDTAAGRKKL